jgi:hypothetical protein
MVLGSVAAAGGAAGGADNSGWQVIDSGEDQREVAGRNHQCKYIENDLGL